MDVRRFSSSEPVSETDESFDIEMEDKVRPDYEESPLPQLASVTPLSKGVNLSVALAESPYYREFGDKGLIRSFRVGWGPNGVYTIPRGVNPHPLFRSFLVQRVEVQEEGVCNVWRLIVLRPSRQQIRC
jgi:hypothetical protein